MYDPQPQNYRELVAASRKIFSVSVNFASFRWQLESQIERGKAAHSDLISRAATKRNRRPDDWSFNHRGLFSPARCTRSYSQTSNSPSFPNASIGNLGETGNWTPD